VTGPVDVYTDLAAEQDQLAAMLAGLSPAGWEKPSAAAGWSISDVVLHLAQTEEMVVATVSGEAAGFERPPGGPSIDELAGQAVASERDTASDAVFGRWQAARQAALAALRGCAPDRKLPWAAAPLSPMTLATTRLAEHWAHALDIATPLGLPYPDTARLRHVAWLAMRTLPYAFALAGQQQAPAVRSELTAPDGELWRFGPDGAPAVISGPAGAFCRVAAQRLAPEASGLTTQGPGAAEALQLVRTYAA
jgi:uncharacterized protein (TIGR03084 family)